MKRKISLLLYIMVCFPGLLFAESPRGLDINPRELGSDAVIGKQWLVVIGMNQYKEWPNLRYPVHDAQQIQDIIIKRYYIDEVITLFDQQATKGNITRLFLDLQESVAIHDSVLIYYAGHGYLDENSNTGFWIPYDGGTDGFTQRNWLPNTQIRGYISNIKSIHICLIVDACFSGDILDINRGKPDEITKEYFRRAYKRTSRQVLTSGSLESVPDKSEFAFLLTRALEKNISPFVDPLMLYQEIRLGMLKTAPLLGELKYTGHQEGASFLLFLKDTIPEPQVNTDATEESVRAGLEEKRNNATDRENKEHDTSTPEHGEKEKSARAPEENNETEDKKHNREQNKDDSTKSEQVQIENKIKVPDQMVYVKGGVFSMGSTEGVEDERPVHEVRVSDFFMGIHEVTFNEYEIFCAETGRKKPEDNGWGRGWRPVIYVSWHDTLEYCNWLSEKHKVTPCYRINGKKVIWDKTANGYRLPTEAEWEYAARGGRESHGFLYAGHNNLHQVAWYQKNSSRETQPVGKKTPNELGMYDMSGNVWEWCWDRYDKNSYIVSEVIDPSGPDSGSKRVLRGGSWYNSMIYQTVSVRGYGKPESRDDYFGFRLVRTVCPDN